MTQSSQMLLSKRKYWRFWLYWAFNQPIRLQGFFSLANQIAGFWLKLHISFFFSIFQTSLRQPFFLVWPLETCGPWWLSMPDTWMRLRKLWLLAVFFRKIQKNSSFLEVNWPLNL
jgi:hypothetical protein